MEFRDRVIQWVESTQEHWINAFQQYEPRQSFKREQWKREGGGGGDTRVLSFGDVYEKVGVNSSVVYGQLSERMRKTLNTSVDEFFATGVSMVAHPNSPKVPTVHGNFRYFEQADQAWFGGGLDLTPYVPVKEDVIHFHKTLKTVCESYRANAYDQFKRECDSYFFIKHRDEHRGVGGIFFDYLKDDLETTFHFVQRAANAFIDGYFPLVERRYQEKYTARQKQFQLLRRGRYVEFNLIYDRGTLFGLETKGNIESILMSLPPEVHFHYRPDLESNDEEKLLMGWLRNPQQWV